MKTKKVLWGVFFIAAAVLVVVNRLGYLTGINLWSLMLTVLLIPVVVSGFYRRSFFNFFFGIAFLLIVYAEPLHIRALVPWTVLLSALFLSIGFSILIPQKHKNRWHDHQGDWKWWHDHHYEDRETVDHVEGNEVNCRVSLGGSCKYLHSDSLQSGHFECSMGYLKAYFDHVKLHPQGAVIKVDCSMGNIEFFLPAEWNVVLNVDTFLGNVDETLRSRHIPDGPALTIVGNVQLGNLVIKYI